MNAMDYWKIFLETGAPEAYLSYTKLRMTEGNHVSNDPWPGSAGHGLQ